MEQEQLQGEWPCFSEEEAQAVKRVLLSNKVNYWTGDQGRQFESEFASFAGANYGVALANGTVALEGALRALGIGPGDEVVVTSRTFLASVSSIIAVGARPVFADVNPDSQNITALSIAEVVTSRTRAVICVHLNGWPCDMDEICALAAQRRLFVIEDCAQAHGAKYKNRPIGSLGDIAAWSFCQDKIMTTGGEGGMITTNSEELWSKVWSYKDHGKDFGRIKATKDEFGFKWVHSHFGTNWRMTEMQAAIGRIQLSRIDKWNQIRTSNANRVLDYCAQFGDIFRVPRPPEYCQHGWYKCYVFVHPQYGGVIRDKMIRIINQYNVPCAQGSCSEVYLEAAFDATNYRPPRRMQVARELGDTSLAFLVHPTLSEQDIDRTCFAIGKAVANL